MIICLRLKNQSIFLLSGPDHTYWIFVVAKLGQRERLDHCIIRNNDLNSLNLWNITYINGLRWAWSQFTQYTLCLGSLWFNSFHSIQTRNDRKTHKSYYSTHSLALGLQKALVTAITIKVLQAFSGSALWVLSNQPGRRLASRAQLSADTAVSPPLLPRAKDGHARSSASAFLTFLWACHICASQSDWPGPVNTARAWLNTHTHTHVHVCF